MYQSTNHRPLRPIIIRAYDGPYCRQVLEGCLVGWLFNVPFQHKYGYIRQAWCCLQVKLCDPCLSALCVPWCKKALNKYSFFPFLYQRWTCYKVQQMQNCMASLSYTITYKTSTCRQVITFSFSRNLSPIASLSSFSIPSSLLITFSCSCSMYLRCCCFTFSST